MESYVQIYRVLHNNYRKCIICLNDNWQKISPALNSFADRWLRREKKRIRFYIPFEINDSSFSQSLDFYKRLFDRRYTIGYTELASCLVHVAVHIKI